ncbi:hypothetical protein CHLNCDRAFT_134476 [Chlorella variabilis]|uniref:Uncharacterized protein n=1 Tax=Chlorella variabilis TaxID=554065 RepID=E1ZG25_CHLVA|nr:hypothetical protein CHLNCDRAFT_134476 [Chlorella variabilis]EFN55388.1 hypothetical protein CHLNCDRAFT_134476 [Chlorella variabilis]|eukprot:XP_005847490.1 hypothetical protein CHLNCDRAFT_134476 [Chlorella variabilis]
MRDPAGQLPAGREGPAQKRLGLFSRLRSARHGKGASLAAAVSEALGDASSARQSSDSTLQPVGRPSSLPSARSSFDSCGDDAPMSDPNHSHRESLDESNAITAASAYDDAVARGIGAAEAAAAAQFAAAAMAAQSQFMQQAAGPHQAAPREAPPPGGLSSFSASLPAAPSPSDSSCSSASDRQQPPGGADRRRPSPLSSSGAKPGHDGGRRHGSGKHAENLEHGSTAPPGGIDELAEMLLAAASIGAAAEAGGSTSTSNGGGTPGPASDLYLQPLQVTSSAPAVVAAAGGGGAAGGQHSAASRLSAGRHSAPPAHGAEPLLNSQVALLAQQLLAQQQAAAAAAAGSSAARLRHSIQLGAEHQQQQQQQAQWQPPRPVPLDRSRTMPAADLARGRAGGPLNAAQLLLQGGGSGGPRALGPLPPQAPGGGSRSMGAIMGLAVLDAAAQPRSSPPQLEELEPSPFSSVQGVYGCHLLPPTDVSDPLPEPSPRPNSRQAAAASLAGSAVPSSIDLLLDPALPATSRAASHRHSLDTLQELFATTPVALSAGTPGRPTVAQLMQQFPSGRGGGGGGGNAVRHIGVRHSMDEGRRTQHASRALAALAATRRGARAAAVDPASSYYGHINAGAMHDLANSTVTVVAGAVPVPAAAAGRATTSISAHASSMVDPAAKPVAGTFEARIGTPQETMLDPDLHDTFGAHPSYGLSPTRPAPHRRTASGGSPASDAGRGSGAATPTAATSDGWRQPPAAARRRHAPAGAPAPGPGLHHPTVYQPHQPPVGAAALEEMSPIGNAMMLAPTSIPGQHSITVNDPQAIVPSLSFLKQRALARQKLERLDQAQQASAAASRGGYIAEAKRVLAAAVHTATAQEAAVVESSCSGAIGPLLRYLRDNKHNDAALRSGLHTLSLLVSNSPNRGIIVSFHGQAMLCEAMRASRDLGIRENIVQLLWDLEAHNQECHLDPDDIQALQSVLEATSNALIASHILHLLHHCLAHPEPPPMTAEQMQLCAQRLVNEIAAHKHHLQDAAQYTLGNLMAVVLGDGRVGVPQRQAMVARLLEELRRTTTPGQCQVVLTVLSCVAGEPSVRSAMAACHARRRLMDFSQRVGDPRLRARSLSLIKILHKQEAMESRPEQAVGSWYFGGGGGGGGGSGPGTSGSSPPRSR